MPYNIKYSDDLSVLEVIINTPITNQNTLTTYVSDVAATLNTCTQQSFVRIDARNQKFDDVHAVLKSMRCHNNISILDHNMTAGVLVIVNNPILKDEINKMNTETHIPEIKAFLEPAMAHAYIHNATQDA